MNGLQKLITNIIIPSLSFNNPKFRRSLESEKSVGFDTESGIGWPGNADDSVGRSHTPVPRDHPSRRLSTRFSVCLASSNNRVVEQSTNRFIVWAGICPLGGKSGDSDPVISYKIRSERRSVPLPGSATHGYRRPAYETATRRPSRRCSRVRWPRFPHLAVRPHPSRHGSERADPNPASSNPVIRQKDVR
jgi:hypothetical protein